LVGYWKEGDHWKNPVLDGTIDIKLDLEEAGCKCMDWIDLVQVRDNWWAVVNAEIKHYISQIAGNFLTS